MSRNLTSLAINAVRLLARTWRLEVLGAQHVERLRSDGVPVVFTVMVLMTVWSDTRMTLITGSA